MLIALVSPPQRDICVCCGKPTELKDYAPRRAVCMACALEDKEQGHRRVFRLEPECST